MRFDPNIFADKRCSGREARQSAGCRMHPGVVASLVKGSLGVFDNVATVAKEAGGAGEELDRRGSRTVLRSLGSLRQAIPDGSGNDNRGLVVAAHLDDGPSGSAQARSTALDAGAVVEDVAVECPLVTVRDLAPIFDVFDAAVGDGRFHAPAEVGAKTTREGGTGGAASKGLPDKLWWRHASSGLHSDGAVAFPDAMEHRVGFLFAELTIGIDVVSLFNESVFRPYRIAGDRAERTFL